MVGRLQPRFRHKNEHLKLERATVNLGKFGMKGNGSDETDKFERALASGENLSGAGLIYGVSGNMVLPDDFRMEDLTLLQLDPDDASRRTLTKVSGSGPLTLRRVKIDRNGTGTSGSTADAAGIWISSIDDILFEDVEVTGDSLGTGILLGTCQRVKLLRPYIHDIRWTADVDPASERVAGLVLLTCTDVEVVEPHIAEMTGSIAGAEYLPGGSGDGLTLGNCTNVSIRGGWISRCGDGSDVTGSGVNENVWFYGTRYSDCNYGQKLIHKVYNSGSVGCRAYRCGLSGLVVGGTQPSSGNSNGPRNLRITDFVSIDTGYGGIYEPLGLLPIGISVGAGTSNNYPPNNVGLTDCTSIDTQVAYCTISTATPCVVTKTAHGKAVSDRVYFTVGDTSVLPNGISLNTMYYVLTVPTANTFTISATDGGAAIATTAYAAWVGPGTPYVAGNVRTESGIAYICVTAHTSAAAFATDAAKWRVNLASYNCSMPTMRIGIRNESLLSNVVAFHNPYTFGARLVDWGSTSTPGIWTPPDGVSQLGTFLVGTGGIGTKPAWDLNVHCRKLFSTGRGTITLADLPDKNLAATVTESLVSVSGPTSDFDLGGIVPTQTSGQHLYIYSHTYGMTILDASGSGAAAGNGILTSTGADVVLTGRCMAHLIYNGTYNSWILMSAST